MTEENNIMLRLLREIREDQQDHSSQLMKFDARLAVVNDSISTALGLAAHASVKAEDAAFKANARFDNLSEQIDALNRRVAALEARR